MIKTTHNLSDKLKEKEEQLYNRFYQKIYLRRILKSSDLKYALNEYEKGFAFDLTFPTGLNPNFDEFINYFEEAEKLGHSFDSAIRLAKTKDFRETERKFANIKKNEQLGTVGIVYFEKEAQDTSTATSPDASIWSLVGHFSEIPAADLIAEYAMWKAKKRFLGLLQKELSQFELEPVREMNLNSTSDSEADDKMPNMEMVPQLKELHSTLSEDAFKEIADVMFNASLTTKVLPSFPVLESKTSTHEHFTITQLAEFLHCSKPTIHNYKKAGLPYYRIGRKVLFEKKKVLEFMKTIKSR